MKTLVLALVFVSPPFLKNHLLRWLMGAKIGRRVQIGWFSAIVGSQIEIGDYSEIRALSVVRCAGQVKIGAYSIISNMVLIYGAKGLLLGNHCYIGPQCLINVDRNVSLGDKSALGPRCMVFTHGSFLPYSEGYWVKFAGVSIGRYAWIAAGVFIQPGVTVGDEVFVNARSVLTEDVPCGQAVAGNPARPVAAMKRIKRVMKPARLDEAADHILRQFSQMVLQGRLGLGVHEDAGGMNFRYSGRSYLLSCISSNGERPINGAMNSNQRCIFLINRMDWTPPPHLKNPMLFDLRNHRTKFYKDRIHAELLQFMRMYYGMVFEFQK